MFNEHLAVRAYLESKRISIKSLGKVHYDLFAGQARPLNLAVQRPKYLVGSRFKPAEDKIIHIDFPDLLNLGLILVSVPVSKPWFERQVVMYIITQKYRIPKDAVILKGLPPKHFLEMDTVNNRVRICGRNAGPLKIGHWVNI